MYRYMATTASYRQGRDLHSHLAEELTTRDFNVPWDWEIMTNQEGTRTRT